MFIFLFIVTLSITTNAQNKPVYPEPKAGFKRVDLMLPRIENEKDFKIEVKFAYVTQIDECSDASFSFNKKNLKEFYGIPNSSRFPYYVLESKDWEIFTGKRPGCESKIKVDKKIFSDQNIFIEYQSYYVRPFYIPESWTIQYRIWAASDYISIEE